MTQLSVDNKNEIVMKLLHYFITIEGYNPIILHGAENEIWLENVDSSYKIVRIVTNHIHNNEQFDFDIFKTKKITSMIKRKMLLWKMKVLSIFIDLGDNVELESDRIIDCVHINSEADLKKYDFIVAEFPLMKTKLKYNEKGVALFSKITAEINKKNQEDSKKNNDIFKPKPIIVTYLIIAINIIMYLLMETIGKGSNDPLTLLRFGALLAPLVRGGQYLRLITSAFLHVGLIHLFFNNYILYIIGSQIETFFGKSKFLLIYLFSGITGALMSMLFTNAISAGASGAIFGLLGSLLYFGYHYRVYLGNTMQTQIVPLIIINLFLGFIIPGIDNAAHIGGLIGGISMASALGVKYKSSFTERLNGIIICVGIFVFLLYMAFIYTI
ncbi:MAG: rhomboid family intramembrane serine protease [Bacilli bacterium]|jgi:rhomboid protease GluP|nr:rhomboid family intramembrane serine protease [Bacilli bacterium]